MRPVFQHIPCCSGHTFRPPLSRPRPAAAARWKCELGMPSSHTVAGWWGWVCRFCGRHCRVVINCRRFLGNPSRASGKALPGAAVLGAPSIAQVCPLRQDSSRIWPYHGSGPHPSNAYHCGAYSCRDSARRCVSSCARCFAFMAHTTLIVECTAPVGPASAACTPIGSRRFSKRAPSSASTQSPAPACASLSTPCLDRGSLRAD